MKIKFRRIKMKIKSIICILLLLVLSMGMYSCKDRNDEEKVGYSNAYITLDINPSIEIITNEEGLIEQVNALNSDAEVLLVETDFTGKTVEETIDLVLNLAMELGYIIEYEDNEILITTQIDNEELKENLDNNLDEVINQFKEKNQIRMQVHHENQKATKEMKNQAESLGISVGKLKLINKVLEVDYELTLEDTANMSVKDLNRILINNRKELNEIGKRFNKYQYMNLNSTMHEQINFKRVELIYELMIEKEDSFFSEIIANSDASVEEIKNLYKQ